MKALCVRQPYAELIARGVKTIEVRTWETAYRGPILIVASSSVWREDMPKFGLTDRDCPRSRIVCVVTLAEIFQLGDLRGRQRVAANQAACCELQRGDHLWCLEKPRRVDPVDVKGKLRLFEVADDLVTMGGWPAAPVPPCAAAMGCLCAGHARGNAATALCDTRE